jgi:hypothetical protein
MLIRFSLADRQRYPIAFVAVSACAYALLFAGFPTKSNDLVIPVTGLLAGLGYFLYAQHLQETRLFVDVFRQFNERYDCLNEDMNRIRESGTIQPAVETEKMLTAQDEQILFDYFNLCAEEYLYFKSGYIDKQVWHSWCCGMAFFAEAKEVRRIWDSELKTGSYYGFSLSLLSECRELKGLGSK